MEGLTLRNATLEQKRIVFKRLDEISKKDLKQKVRVLNFFYFSQILVVLAIIVVILIKG